MCSLDSLLGMLLLYEEKKLMQPRQILSCMDFDELIMLGM